MKYQFSALNLNLTDSITYTQRTKTFCRTHGQCLTLH